MKMSTVTAELTLREHLQKYFGFDKFKGDQEPIIKNVLAGKDAFVIMPPGGGKSLCYQLPALIMDGTAVVVSPLIALGGGRGGAGRGGGGGGGGARFRN